MNNSESMVCLSCKSLRGKITISPAPVIYNGQYWQVEHAYPTAIVGWVVIVCKRHCQALHELTKKEYQELIVIQEALVKALHQELRCQKEYFACFAEKKGFNHIHFHVIARPENFPVKVRGPRVFSLLGADIQKPASPKKVIRFCNNLTKRLKNKITR